MPLKRFGSRLLFVLFWSSLAGIATWGVMALWYRAPFETAGRLGIILGWLLVLASAAGFFAIHRRGRALSLFAVAGAAMFAWWSSILPPATGNWMPELARTVRGRVDGNQLELTDVRNFDWRSDTDFTPQWETRRYDLSKLATMDLIAEYWMGEPIAHIMVSFGFSDGQFLAWSAELRRQQSQSFSVIEGLFKQAPLIMLAADERDTVRRRSNIWHDDMRLYRLQIGPEVARQALLEYVAEANDLADHPRWYNTVISNCTTVPFKIARIVEPGIPLDWRVLASGYFPDYAYDRHALDRKLPFAQLRQRAGINARAMAADGTSSLVFSQEIRAGIPGIR